MIVPALPSPVPALESLSSVALPSGTIDSYSRIFSDDVASTGLCRFRAVVILNIIDEKFSKSLLTAGIGERYKVGTVDVALTLAALFSLLRASGLRFFYGKKINIRISVLSDPLEIVKPQVSKIFQPRLSADSQGAP